MAAFITGYSSLFFGSFLASTLIPVSSEAMLLFILTKNYDPWICLTIATAGNTLGGLTNYAVGLIGHPLWLKRLGLKEEKLMRFEGHVKKYGYWLSLLSWVPIIGDPMTAALGFFRVPFRPVFYLMILGKFLRYLLLIVPFL